jgi:hypothetical protein
VKNEGKEDTTDLPAAEVAEMTPRWLAAVDKKYDRASPSESCG